jgi:cytochrome c-type biogenesis protein CcmF
MLPTIGHAAILAALGLSLYAAGAFALGARRGDAAVVASARRAMYLTLGLAILASSAMVAALLTHDFSVLYVARNNSTTTPPFFSVISLWAALEGSILFWGLVLAAYSAVVVYRYRARYRALMPWVGATLALIGAFFWFVMAVPASPFQRLVPVPSEGPGPNALLQNHPFMGLHPPLLYLGFVGMSVPFAFAVAALMTRRTDESWLAIVRRWTLVPWVFLTLGIVAGAWWSYEVLGWGGYWAWDPVENASLLPWLTATAFLHSSMVSERRGALRIWTLALVIATFELTLLGTFLTRSGVVASVHSFTQSLIGPVFLAAVLASLTASLALLVWRLPELRDGRPPAAPVSRESAFLFNNLLLLGITFAVLFGTLYPLLVAAVGGLQVSVGAPWFNRVNVPITVALLFLMGVGPALPWGAASWRTVRERFRLPLLAALAGLVGALILGLRTPAALATLGLAAFAATVMVDEVARGGAARSRRRGEPAPLAAWRLATRNRRRYGGYLVHLGVLVMAVAIAVSSSLASETTAVLRPGDVAALAGYRIRHDGLAIEPLAEDPRVSEARVELAIAGRGDGRLASALRQYPSSPQAIATPGVRSSLADDLYVTLMAYDPDTGEVTLRLFVNPLVAWIWLGGGILAAGAVFAGWPVRRAAVSTDAATAAMAPRSAAAAPLTPAAERERG